MSDSSSLSDVPSLEDEKTIVPLNPTLKLVNGKLGGFSRKRPSPASSPEPDQTDLGREASPPHEYVLADNPDIAFIVMFQSRFDAAIPKNVPSLGPQDIENGVVAPGSSEAVENLLCALLGLALNRKKNPERGHYGRALEECLTTHKSQWPHSWAGRSPIAGNRAFQAFTPLEKINLLRTLVHWSLANSEAVATIIKDSYKQSRKDDDINQPLSVQPWGQDTRKRKFYLVEGLVDAPFRIYRESEQKASSYMWINVAGTIEEAQKLARDLRAEKSQGAHRLAARITNAVPMFEEREDKRRRREYRKAQKERFVRPDPGFSLYEGRTRGKRMRYTYDEEDIYGTDDNARPQRRSRTETPTDGPTFTASGRAVRSAFGRSYGDKPRHGGGSSTHASSPIGEEDGSDNRRQSTRAHGRARRTAPKHRLPHPNGRSHVDDFDDGSDAESTGEDWAGDDQDFEGRFDEDEGNDDADESSIASSDDELGLPQEPRSLVVRLRCGPRIAQVLNDPDRDLVVTREVPGSEALPASAPSSSQPLLDSETVANGTNVRQSMGPSTSDEQLQRDVQRSTAPIDTVSHTLPAHSRPTYSSHTTGYASDHKSSGFSNNIDVNHLTDGQADLQTGEPPRQTSHPSGPSSFVAALNSTQGPAPSKNSEFTLAKAPMHYQASQTSERPP